MMGQFFFILIAIFLSLKIFQKDGTEKLPWFFMGILFFPHSIVLLSNPNISFPRYLILILFIVFFIQTKNLKRKFLKFPLHFPLFLVFLGLLLIGIFDVRLNIILKFTRPFFYFLDNFGSIFLTFFYVKSIRDVKKIYNFIIICFVFFGLYGIVNYVIGINLYTSFIAEIFESIDFGNWYSILGDSRFRISSFAWHPIYYGLLLSLAILLLVFIYYEKPMQVYIKSFYIVILGLLCINLFLTNSRTPLVSLIIGQIFFYVFAIKLKNRIKIALIGIVILFGLVSISPDSLKLIDESINTFTGKGSKLEGSSLEMREIQMGASFLIFNQNPVFGNGFNYITEELGYSSDNEKIDSDSDFAGFESYIYELLIEQGGVGIFINFFFFIYLIIYLFKIRNQTNFMGKRIIYLSISMVITFLLFIIGTGDMGGFMIFMALLGVNLKAVQLSLKNIQFNRLLSRQVPNHILSIKYWKHSRNNIFLKNNFSVKKYMK